MPFKPKKVALSPHTLFSMFVYAFSKRAEITAAENSKKTHDAVVTNVLADFKKAGIEPGRMVKFLSNRAQKVKTVKVVDMRVICFDTAGAVLAIDFKSKKIMGCYPSFPSTLLVEKCERKK